MTQPTPEEAPGRPGSESDAQQAAQGEGQPVDRGEFHPDSPEGRGGRMEDLNPDDFE